MESHLKYMHGFGNHFESESIPDALPKNQNSPQVCSSCKSTARVRFA
jgi:homogentisate 1,2-dioxygenase